MPTKIENAHLISFRRGFMLPNDPKLSHGHVRSIICILLMIKGRLPPDFDQRTGPGVPSSRLGVPFMSQLTFRKIFGPSAWDFKEENACLLPLPLLTVAAFHLVDFLGRPKLLTRSFISIRKF